jgi:hypothetical protein
MSDKLPTLFYNIGQHKKVFLYEIISVPVRSRNATQFGG